MNAPAAKILADAFLKGFFDVFDAMLSHNFQTTIDEPGEASESDLAGLLQHFPVQMNGVLQQGLGQVTLLFGLADVIRFVTELSGPTADPEELNNADKSTLREIADPAIGGGVSGVMDRCGHAPVQLQGVTIDDGGVAAAGALVAGIGANAISVGFTYDGGDGMKGKGVALFSSGMDTLVPESVVAKASKSAIVEPLLNPDELNDILGGFPGAGGAAMAAPAPAPERRAPMLSAGERDNLDLVLDIRPLATARLGRVEMPLGDILNLGPGSILEIGHLVDEPIELLINDKLIARGDVVVVDEKFGLRITEIVSQKDRIESLR